MQPRLSLRPVRELWADLLLLYCVQLLPMWMTMSMHASCGWQTGSEASMAADHLVFDGQTPANGELSVELKRKRTV